MERVSSMSAASVVAPPSPELCLLAGLIIAQTKGKPKKVTELVEGVRSFVDAHASMGSDIVRLRGAEYDGAVLESMAQAAEWLERMEPFLTMMARR